MSDEIKDQNEEETIQIGSHTVEVWLYDLYFQESLKLLDIMKTGQSNLRYKGIDPDIVRAFHTLGSTSRTLGIQDVAKLGYAMEGLLDVLVQKNQVSHDTSIPENILVLLEEGCMAMEKQVHHIRNKEPIEEFFALINSLSAMSEVLASDAQSLEDSPVVHGDSVAFFDVNSSSSNGWDSGDIFGTLSSDPFGDSSGGDDWLSSLENISAETEKALGVEVHVPQDLSLLDSPPAEIKVELSVKKEENKAIDKKVHSLKNVDQKPTTQMIDQQDRLSFTGLPESIRFLEVHEGVQDDIDNDILALFVDESSEILPQMYTFLEGWKNDKGDQNTENCRLLKRVLHTIKGSSRMAGCMRFGSFIHNIEHMVEAGHEGASAEDIANYTAIACEIAGHEVDVIQKFGGVQMSLDAPVNVANAEQKTKNTVSQQMGQQVSQTLRVPIERMDKMSASLAQSGMLHQRIVSDLSKFDTSLVEMSENLDRLKRLISEVEIQAEVQMQSRIAVAGDNFDPLEFDRFTRLQELTRMVTENMHDISMVQGTMEKSVMTMSDAVQEQNLVEDDLRYEVMTSRMLPISSLSIRLDKLIRQACRDTGKSALLDIEGAEEIDSGVLNKVIVPLEHLLRNAVAHGIESKDKRVLSGKKESGMIKLSVKQVGNEIHFDVQDDGAGINKEVVSRKAAEVGLIPHGDVLTQEKANEMIFAAGFSTAESVSQISGRGVGLDVVKGEILSMGGWLQVDSTPGKGTHFLITVPSYMALMATVPIEVGKDLYGIPAALVRDIQVLSRDALEFGYATGALIVGDKEYPLYHFGKMIHSSYDIEMQRNNTVVILEEAGRFVAIHVEKIRTDANLVIRPLCKTVAAIPGVIGSSISGEGLPFPILNPIRMKKEAVVLDIMYSSSDGSSKNIKSSRKTVDQILVMVVDDSLTVRKVTERFLTREGYKVITGRDGMDALEVLQGCEPDIFLLDIEMPRMDGFELAQTLRNTDKTRTTPIVMISSRAIEKHQEHAFSLGVNAYLGKPYQESQLLEQIQKWTDHVPVQILSQ